MSVIIHLACGHHEKWQKPDPDRLLPTEYCWCYKCRNDIDIRSVEHRFVVKCTNKGCYYTRYLGLQQQQAARQTAARHKADRGHRVIVWRTDDSQSVMVFTPSDDPLELVVQEIKDQFHGTELRKDPRF